jgi:hypothetical protein
MSGTSGMLVALAEFNFKNTGTFYPDLYKLKLQILNANKKGLINNSYTYTPRVAADVSTQILEYKYILAELKRLFPDYNLYCTKNSLVSTGGAPNLAATPSSNAYFLYTTGTQPSLSHTANYLWYIYIPCVTITLSTANTGSWST